MKLDKTQILEKEWKTEAGLEAAVVIHPAGHRCGYVRMPAEHPYHGLGYDEMSICVHGGVTYSEEHDDGMWIGFDCAHYEDAPDPKFVNEDFKMVFYKGGVVRTLEFCVEECESIAKQLMEKK